MPGTLMRAIAIIPAGMFLSHPPATSTPSMHWPFTDVSIASAITSRETSEYFIPSVPMPMPSVTVGTPNTCGMAPASLSAAIARSTSGWMPALHGFIVLWPLATPTMGFSKSLSPKPTARSIARLGERATPAVMSWLRLLRDLSAAMGMSPEIYRSQYYHPCHSRVGGYPPPPQAGEGRVGASTRIRNIELVPASAGMTRRWRLYNGSRILTHPRIDTH